MIDWWMEIKNIKEWWRLIGWMRRKKGLKMKGINSKYEEMENEKWMENSAKNMKIMIKNDRLGNGD